MSFNAVEELACGDIPQTNSAIGTPTRECSPITTK